MLRMYIHILDDGDEQERRSTKETFLGDKRIYIQAGGSGDCRSECIDSYQMDAVRRIPVCRSRKGSEDSQAAVFLNWLNEHREGVDITWHLSGTGERHTLWYIKSWMRMEKNIQHLKHLLRRKKQINGKKEIEYKQSIGKFEVQKCATLKELIEEYVQIYGHDKWGVSTYSGNVALINNYILPTIGDTKLASINTHFMEKYYKDLLKMPAVKSTKNPDGTGTITESTVNEIHKVLRSCFRQAVKWDMMEKNPAVDATVPKAKKQEREIWTAEMLMQALEACDNKMLKIAFHLAFTATLRIGELLGLTWDDMDISEEAIADNKAYVIINKQVERVSKDAIEALNSKEIIMIFPSQKKNNRTVRVLKTPKTDSSVRKVFIPKSVAQCLIDLKADQDEIKEVLGNEYQDYNLVMATTFGLPIGDSYLRTKMQEIIDELGLARYSVSQLASYQCHLQVEIKWWRY